LGINPERRYLVTEKIKGVIVGVRKVQDRGRVQIPKTIREKMRLKDGDSVYWLIDPEGKYFIVKAGEIETAR